MREVKRAAIYVRRRKFDVVVVWALDRLARSLKQLLTIGEECQFLGVDLFSLKQNIDTTLPAGRLTFQILGAVAELERELLRERVKAGMAQARRAGKHVGRPALRKF
jgi:DNA invertase Pin-like site-specific DNA recombinase